MSKEIKESLDIYKRTKSLLDSVKEIKRRGKESVLIFSETVPSEHFEFICYRELPLQFVAIFKIIDSDYYLCIKNEEELFIYLDYDNKKQGRGASLGPFVPSPEHGIYFSRLFKPLEDERRFRHHVDKYKRYSVPLEEALLDVPKEAGAFMCFHLHAFKAKS